MTMSDSDRKTAAAPGTKPGQALAAARARKNFSVIEVAQHLKLSASQVEALEADAYERLPGSVFVRGFVRNYARLVNLDPEALVDGLGLSHEPTTAIEAVPRSQDIPFPERQPSNWTHYAGVLFVVIAALALFVFMTDTQRVVVTAHPPAVSDSVVPVAPTPVGTPETPAAPVASRQPAPDATQSTLKSVGADIPPAAASATASSIQAESAEDAAIPLSDLHFVFDQDSWVEVRDRRNRLLLAQLHPAGTEYHVQGKAPLSLVVGNARAVRLTYNGAPVDLAPHTRVDVARVTLK